MSKQAEINQVSAQNIRQIALLCKNVNKLFRIWFSPNIRQIERNYAQLRKNVNKLSRIFSQLTWASCRVLQESHWNLLSLHKVSVLLKFLKQLVMDVFCSTSILKSKKSSSLLVTVSQFKQRVSLVKMPWKISLIQVGFLWSLLESALEFLLGLPLTWFRSA